MSNQTQDQTENQTSTQPIEATDANFQTVVLEGSHQTPVVVDFWAPWCGPCKVIGPVLEKAAVEWDGRFQLVKVNMDENPILAQTFMIKSIPTVKLIINGEVRDEFVGAYPEPEIRKFLQNNLPSPSQNGAGEGLKLWLAGQESEALRIFEAVLAEDPDNPVALVGMGCHLIGAGDLDGARQIVDRISDFQLDKVVDKAAAEAALAGLRARVFLMEHAANGDSDESPAEGPGLDGRFAAACRLALEESYEDALRDFLAIVKKDRKYRDDAGRKGMLAVFELLSKDSPLLPTFRAELSSALFS